MAGASWSARRATAHELALRRVRTMPPARRLRFALAREALEQCANGEPLRVLDAGCGDGLLASSVARAHPDWVVRGVDLREEALARARDEARRSGAVNASFACADVAQDIGTDRYDVVLALECLEEIRDDRGALAAMARALRPGGSLLAHVPERGWKPVLPRSAKTWRDEVRHGYGEREIVELLEQAGLAVTGVRATTRGTVRLAQEVRDRIKRASLKVQLAAYPAMAVCVRLERLGVTWGPPRGLFVVARRP